ncbi:unnamed protein product [Didymodactylos carnosus]|uniref:Uncharacterized protein n=1 Tax=Didymodactylos carnosus TaxID=1234261 RepID=A0A814QBK4_9BILA|nr:unnamed protein product [Didymodactylos carnosus]CAF1116487.1 unnamed protein product [Didymodactylos carnosus]CAF3813842.1 unnamed protein product [Didymodactylos carnosus]CAF3880321.1 unnamed protein product [Didymodactylos carnosus]
MGSSPSKTIAGLTADLWRSINRGVYDQQSLTRIQNCISNGADITSPNKDRQYMRAVVLEQQQRNSVAGREREVNICQRIITQLQIKASELFIQQLNIGDLNGMRLLVKTLGADCYQGEKYGPLGLVGDALKQPNVRLAIIEFLIENDERNRMALTKRDIDGGETTCIQLATNNKSDVH